MSINNKITSLRAALTALGLKSGKVSVENNRDNISRIFIDGEYFGTFDYVLKTFVD